MSNKSSGVLDPFTIWAHRVGRIFIFLFCIYIMAVPLIMCLVYGVWPSMSQIMAGAISLYAIMIPTTISEVGSYTPILGSSCYLTFATGNLMNLKIPCALNAQKVAGVEQNTVEGDAIALISTCVSSVVTLIVLFIGVLLFLPLGGILQNEYVKTAGDYILPALFGSLTLTNFGRGAGPTYIKNRLSIGLVPAIIAAWLTIIGIGSTGTAGFIIIAMIPVAILCAWILYKTKIVRIAPNPSYKGPKKEEA